MRKQETFYILSIDGGGIRGIIPAMILDYIEKEMYKKAICWAKDDKCRKCVVSAMALKESIPIAQLFDLIAGTSTGGILALALTKPKGKGKEQSAYTAEKLVKLYKKQGKIIFSRSLMAILQSDEDRFEKLQRIVLQPLRLQTLVESKYPPSGMQQVLHTYFGETRLSEALTNVLIPAYDMQGTRYYWKRMSESDSPSLVEREGGHPRFFKSRQVQGACRSKEDYLMRAVAYATAAAPTYFDPIDIPFIRSDKCSLPERLVASLSETLVDGGIFANNPAMCAYAEAMRILQEKGCSKEECSKEECSKEGCSKEECSKEEDSSKDSRILLVSLGTGHLTQDLKAAKAKNWGFPRWIKPLLTMIFDGASDTVDYQLKQLPNVCPYYRFQPRLCKEGVEGMDNTKKAHLSGLMGTAQLFIAENEGKLNELCCHLSCRMIEKLEKKCGACECCNPPE